MPVSVSVNLIGILFDIMESDMDMNFIHKTCHAMSIEENAQLFRYATARLEAAKLSDANDAYAKQCNADNIADLAKWHYDKKLEAAYHAPLV